MKKALFVSLALLFLLQTGCTKSVRYTEDEIQTFPSDIQEHIRKAQIDLGMTQEQVRYAWGNPDSIKILDPYEDKVREEWTYSQPGTLGVVATKILLFYDRKLIYIK